MIARYVDDPDAQATAAVDPSAFNWAAVTASRMRGWFVPCPISYHMLGPMAAVPKPKRAVGQRRKRQPLGQAVRPDDIDNINNEEKQETDKNMEVMWNILRQKERENKPVHLLELVMNHASFSQTVENLFTLSFLVKDNKVELKHSDQGVMVSVARRPDQKQSTADGGPPVVKEKEDKERVQFVVSVNYDEWEIWKRVVHVDKVLMPHRESRVLQDGGEMDGGAIGKSKRVKK